MAPATIETFSRPRITNQGVAITSVSGAEFIHKENFTKDLSNPSMQQYIRVYRAVLLTRNIPTQLGDAIDKNWDRDEGKVRKIPGIGLYVAQGGALGRYTIDRLFLSSDDYWKELLNKINSDRLNKAIEAVGPVQLDRFSWQDQLPGF